MSTPAPQPDTGARSRGPRRSRWILVTVAVSAVILTAVAALVLPRLSGRVPGATAPPPPPFAAVDASYLDGNDYLRGVNVYSLIFAGRNVPTSEIGEPRSSYDFLSSRGVSIVRLAVPWQRLQEIPSGGDAREGLEQPIDTEYLDMVVEQVNRAGAAGIRTVVDLHNGCTYPWGAGDFVAGSVRCGDGITEEHVTRIWSTIADRFRDNGYVLAYDVFNEPRWSVGIDTYKRFAQVAVDAIRSTGDEHTVWVEGILSDTRGRLAAMAPDGPWIVDELGLVMYSEHFYADERGPYQPGADAPEVFDRLREFGDWCTRWNVRCSVGEVGWPSGGPGGVHSQESADGWNDFFEEFYTIADEYRLDVTYFGASGSSDAGTLLAYVASDPGIPARSGIDTALSQTEVIERHLTRPATQ